MSVLLRDVTLRDGLQLTGKVLPTERKIEIVRRLLGLGVPDLEIGSLARPDLVPPLANTLDVVAGLTPEELERCWVWVATPRHVARAVAAGARNVQYCFSVSDAHNRANIGRDTEASLTAMPEAVETALAAGGRIQLCLATTFTCPFDGPVTSDRVLRIVDDPRTEGATDVVLCDTLGQAAPAEVGSLVGRVHRAHPQRRVVFHGHDTWGQGVANTLAAVAAGARMVDGALGGLGGCPFAPGASGNTATEDLLFALRPDWLDPATLVALADLSTHLLAELDEPNRSRAVQGVQSTAAPSPGRPLTRHAQRSPAERACCTGDAERPADAVRPAGRVGDGVPVRSPSGTEAEDRRENADLVDVLRHVLAVLERSHRPGPEWKHSLGGAGGVLRLL